MRTLALIHRIEVEVFVLYWNWLKMVRKGNVCISLLNKLYKKGNYIVY